MSIPSIMEERATAYQALFFRSLQIEGVFPDHQTARVSHDAAAHQLADPHSFRSLRGAPLGGGLTARATLPLR